MNKSIWNGESIEVPLDELTDEEIINILGRPVGMQVIRGRSAIEKQRNKNQAKRKRKQSLRVVSVDVKNKIITLGKNENS